jgi:hypothetical protein
MILRHPIAFAFGLDDAGFEIVPDLFEPCPLRWVRPQERTSHASVLVNAGRAERSSAGADRHLPFLEVREECIPFRVGGGSVFFAGPRGAPTGDERTMRLDRLGRIDGLIAHGRVDGFVAADDLCDIRRQAVHDGVGDEDSTEIVGLEYQRTAVDVGERGCGEALISSLRIAEGVNARRSSPRSSHGRRKTPPRDRSITVSKALDDGAEDSQHVTDRPAGSQNREGARNRMKPGMVPEKQIDSPRISSLVGYPISGNRDWQSRTGTRRPIRIGCCRTPAHHPPRAACAPGASGSRS